MIASCVAQSHLQGAAQCGPRWGRRAGQAPKALKAALVLGCQAGTSVMHEEYSLMKIGCKHLLPDLSNGYLVLGIGQILLCLVPSIAPVNLERRDVLCHQNSCNYPLSYSRRPRAQRLDAKVTVSLPCPGHSLFMRRHTSTLLHVTKP